MILTTKYYKKIMLEKLTTNNTIIIIAITIAVIVFVIVIVVRRKIVHKQNTKTYETFQRIRSDCIRLTHPDETIFVTTFKRPGSTDHDLSLLVDSVLDLFDKAVCPSRVFVGFICHEPEVFWKLYQQKQKFKYYYWPHSLIDHIRVISNDQFAATRVGTRGAGISSNEIPASTTSPGDQTALAKNEKFIFFVTAGSHFSLNWDLLMCQDYLMSAKMSRQSILTYEPTKKLPTNDIDSVAINIPSETKYHYFPPLIDYISKMFKDSKNAMRSDLYTSLDDSQYCHSETDRVYSKYLRYCFVEPHLRLITPERCVPSTGIKFAAAPLALPATPAAPPRSIIYTTHRSVMSPTDQNSGLVKQLVLSTGCAFMSCETWNLVKEALSTAGAASAASAASATCVDDLFVSAVCYTHGCDFFAPNCISIFVVPDTVSAGSGSNNVSNFQNLYECKTHQDALNKCPALGHVRSLENFLKYVGLNSATKSIEGRSQFGLRALDQVSRDEILLKFGSLQQLQRLLAF